MTRCNAMLVRMPTLENIPVSMHHINTRAEKPSAEEQKVKDLAGQVVGRVPANLCKVFRKLLKEGQVKEITAKPTISKVPDSGQSFKRNKKDYDRRGGGAVIPCKYILSCYSSSYDNTVKYITEMIKSEAQGREEVTLEETSASCSW